MPGRLERIAIILAVGDYPGVAEILIYPYYGLTIFSIEVQETLMAEFLADYIFFLKESYEIFKRH